MITIFQNIKSIDAPYHKQLDFVLDRIKTGVSKSLVEEIRSEADKTKRNELKKGLPSILFSGRFPHRKHGALPIEHSGYIIIDIDDIELDKIEAERAIICQSNFVYSCFLSPSGNGFKVLIRIPKDIKRHRDYFAGIELYFAEALDIEIDTSGKNISRVCYESYDPEIYINEKSDLFTDLIEPIEPENKIENAVSIPVSDISEVQKRVITWWEKNYNYVDGSKHYSIIALAGAFNRFGVSESDAISYCCSLATNPKSSKLNEDRVKDMYKRFSSDHGISHFEDKQKTKEISRSIKDQEMEVAINMLREYEEFEQYTPVELESAAKNIQDNSKVKRPTTSNRVFWYFDDGKLKLDLHQFFNFINDCGYWLYYPIKTPDNYQFIKIENNIIRNVDTREIKNEVLKFVLNNDQNLVYNMLNDRTKYWSEKFLNTLPTIDPPILRDTKDIAYLPTQSGVYKVTKNSIEKIDYVDLKEGYVWDTQITKLDFNYTNSDGDFKKFTEAVAGGDNDFLSVQTIIGYLLHNYKDPANPKAPFFFDRNISQLDGEPEGGSGKSLIMEGLKKIREVACISGDRVDFKKQFVLQEISESTQIAWVDEPEKDLDFKNFFTRLTNGLPIEKKNTNSIYIDYDKSPKFVFTGNFMPKGSSGSHKRRRIDFGVSNHYNVDHSPLDEFKRAFFKEWDDEEYNKFFSFYLECLKLYLDKGIVKQVNSAKDYLEIARELGVDFAEFTIVENNLSIWVNSGKINAKEVYDQYVRMYETDILMKNFLKSVRKVLSLRKINFEEVGKGERRVIKILKLK